MTQKLSRSFRWINRNNLGVKRKFSLLTRIRMIDNELLHYPSGSFMWIFSKFSPKFFLCWLWLTLLPVWVCRMKKVTLLIITINAVSCVGVPVEYKLSLIHI